MCTSQVSQDDTARTFKRKAKMGKKYTPTIPEGNDRDPQVGILQQELKTAKLRAKNIEETYKRIRADVQSLNAEKSSLAREN